MNLETLFDDLEAQLSRKEDLRITSFQTLTDARRVRLHFGGEQQFSLVAPILGEDFVAGFDEKTANWMCAAQTQVARIDFDPADDPELPKLRKTQAFQSIQFSSVTKLIRSPVPLSVFLPSEVKPYKDKLDKASGGKTVWRVAAGT